MNGKMDDFDVIDAVDPRALRAYVDGRGWRETESFDDLGAEYKYGNDGVAVFVPTSRRLADFDLRTWETAGAIAKVEDRARSAVLRDLLFLSDVDRVQIRVSESETDGSIHMETGVAVIQNSRDMLLSAACAALRPSRAFDADASKKARAYLDTVRLGHADPGGFAINLLSPVPTDPDTGLTSEPFPRKAVHSLVSALKATRTAADKAAPEFAIEPFESGVSAGVSANMCAAIGGMLRAAKGSDIEISVNWALSRANPPKPARIRFSPPDAPILEKAAKGLG